MIRFKSIAVNLGVLSLVILLLLVVLEVALAIVQINQKSYTRFIPSKGPTMFPGAYYRYSKEGFSEGYINSHGFRDKERTFEKSEDTFRILVLGDSYVEALQVALESSFSALLEKKLNTNSPFNKIEVIALGESGIGTADAYAKYLNFGMDFSPDLVILAFLTGNDFQNNSKFLNREALKFYFIYDDNGDLVLDKSAWEEYERSLTLPKQLFQSLKRHSYLASLISERFFLLRRQIRHSRFESQFSKDTQRVENKKLGEFSNLNMYLPNLPKNWRKAVDISKDSILKFRDKVEEDGAKFVLVSLSTAAQVHTRIREQINERYEVSFDYDQPDRILEEFAEQRKITFLKLMPIFRDYHLKTGKDLHGFRSSGLGHWNENGHQLAAEEILKFLKQTNLVPMSS